MKFKPDLLYIFRIIHILHTWSFPNLNKNLNLIVCFLCLLFIFELCFSYEERIKLRIYCLWQFKIIYDRILNLSWVNKYYIILSLWRFISFRLQNILCIYSLYKSLPIPILILFSISNSYDSISDLFYWYLSSFLLRQLYFLFRPESQV